MAFLRNEAFEALCLKRQNSDHGIRSEWLGTNYNQQNAIADIFSLHKHISVLEKYPVADLYVMVLHVVDGRLLRFTILPSGVYTFLDLRNFHSQKILIDVK